MPPRIGTIPHRSVLDTLEQGSPGSGRAGMLRAGARPAAVPPRCRRGGRVAAPWPAIGAVFFGDGIAIANRMSREVLILDAAGGCFLGTAGVEKVPARTRICPGSRATRTD